MINRKIARRYAKALMNIGREDGNYERYLEELQSFTSLFQTEKQLREALINPTFGASPRQAIITEVGTKLGLSQIVMNLLYVLVTKNRIQALPDVTSVYQELVDEVAGRVRVHLITAYELKNHKLQELTHALEGFVQKKVIMEVEQDQSLIGGVVAKIGGMVYDGSLRTQLEAFKELLEKG